MKSTAFFLSLLPSALGATIYLAGDSTMAAAGGGSGTDGTPSPIHTVIFIANRQQAGASTSHPPSPAPSPTKLSAAAAPAPTHAKGVLRKSPIPYNKATTW